MKNLSRIILAVMLLATVSCSTRKDVTKNPGRWTDYVPGQVYVLKKPAVYQAGMLARPRPRSPLGDEVMINPGELLIVRKIEMSRSLEIGTFVQVYTEFLTGKYKSQTAEVMFISKDEPRYTRRDPEMLEPVNVPAGYELRTGSGVHFDESIPRSSAPARQKAPQPGAPR